MVAAAFIAIAVTAAVRAVDVIDTLPAKFETWPKVTLLADETDSPPKGEAPPAPTIPLKVTVPVPAVRLRELRLLDPRVLKAMFPGPDPVSTTTLPFNVVALTKVTLPPVVVISPAVLIPVDPVNDTVPPEVISPVDKMVKAPPDAVMLMFPTVEVMLAVVVVPVPPIIVISPVAPITPLIKAVPVEAV
jgi:hypothetical protein